MEADESSENHEEIDSILPDEAPHTGIRPDDETESSKNDDAPASDKNSDTTKEVIPSETSKLKIHSETKSEANSENESDDHKLDHTDEDSHTKPHGEEEQPSDLEPNPSKSKDGKHTSEGVKISSTHRSEEHKDESTSEKETRQSDKDAEIIFLKKELKNLYDQNIELTQEQIDEISELDSTIEKLRLTHKYLRENYLKEHPEEDLNNMEVLTEEQAKKLDNLTILDREAPDGMQYAVLHDEVYLDDQPKKSGSKKKSRRSKSPKSNKVSPKMQKYQEQLMVKLLAKDYTLITNIKFEENNDLFVARGRMMPKSRPLSFLMTNEEKKLLKKSMYKKTPEQILLGIRMGETLTPSQKIIQFEQEFEIPTNYVLKTSQTKRKSSSSSFKLPQTSKSEKILPNMPRWGGFRVEPLMDVNDIPDENSIELEENEMYDLEEEDFDDGVKESIKNKWKSDPIEWKFDLPNIADKKTKSKQLVKKLIVQYEVDELFRYPGFRRIGMA